jgi:hypothetical protein
MSFVCKYTCGGKFTAKHSCQRHENDRCKLRPEGLKANKGRVSTVACESSCVPAVCVPIPSQDSVIRELMTLNQNTSQTLQLVMQELKELREEVHKKQVSGDTTHITINNTVIYNHFDSRTIDIFGKMLDLYGSDRAISYSTRLLDVKDKDRKHAWIKNPDLVDAKAMSLVVKCEPKAPQLGFEIMGSDLKLIKDVDGSKLDTILTDTVINAALNAHNHLIREARQAYEAGDENALTNHISNSSIYLPKGQYIQDKYAKFRQIKFNLKQMVEDLTVNVN